MNLPRHTPLTCQEVLDNGWAEMDETEREELVVQERRKMIKSLKKLPANNRPPTKAVETWYELAPFQLRWDFEEYLADVPDTVDGSSLPIAGARAIIAPHAGYFYSGRCSAWAFRCLDLTNIKRVFVIGPTHTYAFKGLHVSTFEQYSTPLGAFDIDQDTIGDLREAAVDSKYHGFDDMLRKGEVDEHSLEMEISFLYKRCEETFGETGSFPKIVPMLVSGEGLYEKQAGKLLHPYLRDPENAFVISSDFCHWGKYFTNYRPYWPQNDEKHAVNLSDWDDAPTDPPIHETIRLMDEQAMEALQSGVHANFTNNLAKTGNSVCGQHPIGAMMAALEHYGADRPDKEQPKFKVVRYNRSTMLTDPRKSSVSYVAAYAIL